ncbi:MAG: hypothetical protein KJ718_00110 [Nanoarchaeota archaeon]|nr:hypothetical protein [Nanoarchaeota archaeon]MBU1050944.1 hypothetical protein [Nanoarchaeota archaeon]MBU1988663.1 hypothetical protein [Nanoarchaeota archaeon]
MNLKKIALTTTLATGLFTLTGCSMFSSGVKCNRDITHPPYVEAISEKALELSQCSDPGNLRDAAKMYLSIRKIEEADEIAIRLLNQSPKYGMDLFGDLQEYRNSNEKGIVSSEK